MKHKKETMLNYFRQQGGLLRFSEILKAGFHSDTLKDLEKEAKIEKIARGLYRISNYTFGSHPDLVLVSFQVPKGIVCLVSALSFYEVTNEIPKYVDIAIPALTRANKIKYPPVKFYRFSSVSWEAGAEVHQIEGYKIRIYNLAKTIADCFKFRNKIGINVARDALKIAISEKRVTPYDIMKYAKICRVVRIVKPILESII